MINGCLVCLKAFNWPMMMILAKLQRLKKNVAFQREKSTYWQGSDGAWQTWSLMPASRRRHPYRLSCRGRKAPSARFLERGMGYLRSHSPWKPLKSQKRPGARRSNLRLLHPAGAEAPEAYSSYDPQWTWAWWKNLDRCSGKVVYCVQLRARSQASRLRLRGGPGESKSPWHEKCLW